MDTTDPDITFDEIGHCNHCNQHYDTLQQNIYEGEKSKLQLAEIIETIKLSGKGKEFDCLVGVSGGVDSCYTAYLCKQYGLKPLLMHLDNGWDSEIAVQNIKNVCKSLELEYVSYVLDWQEFKEIQLAFLRSSIVDLDIPTDLAIPGSLHVTAAKHGIKYLIAGGNYSSEGILPLQWGYHVMKDMKLYNHIVRKYATRRRKHTIAFGLMDETYYKLVKKIKSIYILNYIPYNKDEAKALLENELGWKYYGGKHHESRFTGLWQSYILPVKHNIDYRKATFSTQICSGQMTRDEALKELVKLPYDESKIETDIQFFCKKLGISREEFSEIMKKEPKTYKSFPNQETMIKFVHKMYQKIFPKKRG
jgi:N-acetyl sugar amidotransferase